MTNRLLDLDKALLGRAPAKHKRRKQRRPKTAKPTATPATPPAAELVTAKGAVNYRVPGVVSPRQQPSGMTCWATVTTMMIEWREQKSIAIATAIGTVGSKWLQRFNADQGLPGPQKATFLAAAGLSYQLPQSYGVAGFEALLRRYGPIWVTTDEDPSADFAIHARIATGIHGDGTPDGTLLDIVDPANGTSYTERYSKFVQKYESEALDPKRPVRIQIVHWPHDVGFRVKGKTLTMATSYAAEMSAAFEAGVDEHEFEPAYDESNPSQPGARAQSAFAAALAGTAPMTAADVRWAADGVSPDYRHLAAAIDTKPFTLTAAVIQRLIQCNRFSLDGVASKIVFGLRGCTLDADVAAFTDKIELREIEPNHIDNRCVLGVFDNLAKKITAFRASTVPNWEYMEKYRQSRSKRANLLPTGRYLMTVGTHRPKKKDASGNWTDNPGRIQGALRQGQRIVVLRSEDDLTYTVRDTWDETVPHDNIHPGIVAVQGGTSTVPDYSSAGCNTVPGGSVADAPSGAWADFRKALGLDNARPTSDDGKTFAYVLLTGREARLTSGAATPLPRLRFGSSGAEVRSLQEALAKHPKKFFSGKSDGEFGAATSTAFIKFQKDRDGGAADGIVTPSDATALGFALAAPPVGEFVKPFDVKDVVKKLFSKVVGERAQEGLFKNTSDVAELLHHDTPATVPWKKTTATLKLRALAPSETLKDKARDVVKSLGDTPFIFAFRVEFEHNGYDIKNARILRQIQASSGLKRGKFETTWTAKNATPLNVELGRIDNLLKGTWDPGIGDKSVQDFTGKLQMSADGLMRFDLDPNTRVSVEFFAGGTWHDYKVVNIPSPTQQKVWHSVFFEVNKHVLLNGHLQSIKDWLRTLRPSDSNDTSSKQAVRWSRLLDGTHLVTVEGYASPTGDGAYNQKLSGQRADAVIALLRDELGTNAKFRRVALGEANPEKKTTPKDENLDDRRADISFMVSR
jgi:outer membrane protein OmpA-like peptidoglycan-associated protein/peptidoglycan hydrolase-like protein with peptidoglycan-binding domain